MRREGSVEFPPRDALRRRDEGPTVTDLREQGLQFPDDRVLEVLLLPGVLQPEEVQEVRVTEAVCRDDGTGGGLGVGDLLALVALTTDEVAQVADAELPGDRLVDVEGAGFLGGDGKDRPEVGSNSIVVPARPQSPCRERAGQT